MITKPQADFLTRAMRRPISAYGSDTKVARNLRLSGLIQRASCTDPLSFLLWEPTTAGLEALREFRARRWANHGCMAYLDQLREVEAALA